MSKACNVVIKEEQSLIEELVEQFISVGKRAIEKRGRFSVALSGGKTPIAFYQKLSKFSDPAFWDKTFVFLTDERYVPYTHPHNNFRMIESNLLNNVPIPPANLYPMVTELISIEKSVEDYIKILKKNFKGRGDFPQMDFLLMGVGTDGHTASLFPGTAELEEKTEWVVASKVPSVEHHRISLTMPVFNHGLNICFLVAGADKAVIVTDILQHKKNLPASRVNPLNGKLTYFLDPSAGSVSSE